MRTFLKLSLLLVGLLSMDAAPVNGTDTKLVPLASEADLAAFYFKGCVPGTTKITPLEGGATEYSCTKEKGRRNGSSKHELGTNLFVYSNGAGFDISMGLNLGVIANVQQFHFGGYVNSAWDTSRAVTYPIAQSAQVVDRLPKKCTKDDQFCFDVIDGSENTGTTTAYTHGYQKHDLASIAMLEQRQILTAGMNLHVRTNSESTLMFNIPRKVTAEFSISRILMDTYDLLSPPRRPMVYAAILQHGLSVHDTTYNSITPTPPKLQTYKVNFRRIPQHYKPTDIIQLFSKYGKPKEIGMYYHAHPKRKVYTQDGYVLFEKDEKPSHPELPKEIVAGPGHPIITNIVEAPKPAPTSTATRSNTNKESNNASSAKDAKGQDAAGFRQQRKRNSKKRRKNTQISSSMEGIESTTCRNRCACRPRHTRHTDPAGVYSGS
ncbi:hypothetical protein KI688_009740 [Linnemannia hyalina]|uniref:Uncharacterized protein n=1 Tax=Linnemannia hyalina TaxID=64524 RepID=A0A9P8BWK8_9FUNG|nr:hypothetical protein KI688_009740 [Linnemannia hyalina]